MTLTQKEHGLLTDMKTQEQLCIEKYGKYAAEAHDPCLRELFASIKSAEEGHLATVERIMLGEEVEMPAPPSAKARRRECAASSCTAEQKKQDAFFCRDMLSTEKHVSSLYDVSIFEFVSPALRDTLAHIQKEEQNHGEQLYAYLAKNGMYS